MLRRIVGFHQDDEGHWVAELECGHAQHARHEPPWQVRPWVMTPEGRAGRIGTGLDCPACDVAPRIAARPEGPIVCARGLGRQFARPSGLLGRIAGWVMAWLNRPLAQWAVAALQLEPGHHVVEIGCGPGVGVALAAARVPGGSVVGVDPSEVMLAQARRRNAAAITAGRVRLEPAEVSKLPFPDRSFDRAFAINSVQFWPRPIEDLREVLRVLRPGGRLVLVLQPRWLHTVGEIRALAERLRVQVAAAGFAAPTVEMRPMRPMSAFAVVAHAPAEQAAAA